MGSLDDLVRDLRAFEGRRQMTKHLRARIREPLPTVRAAIKAHARAILPQRGGLNVWVAAAKVTAVIRLSGRAAGVTLKGSRRSLRDKSDLRRLDASGRVRAPSWGRRGEGDWHTQTVPAGWFSTPAGEIDQWRAACEDAVADAVREIARG